MCYPVHPVLFENPSSPPPVVLPPRISQGLRAEFDLISPMEKDLRSLAHQDHHGRYPPAMGSGPAPIQSPLRFCDLSAKSLKGVRRLQQDTSALSRNRLRGPITKSGRDGWSLVNILPGGQERDRQASGLHRSQDDQPVPALRALQDGGHSHACKHAVQLSEFSDAEMSQSVSANTRF